MGKLIVFEGIDGSGKSTQYRRLCDRLKARGIPFRELVFPRYSEPSSMLIRMYLNGEFGKDPSDVNAYAASSFFAADRYASFKTDWGEWYQSGGLVVTDRYTTSNAVHQASKLAPEEQEAFLKWLFDYEYDKLGLPAPDAVIFCDADPELAVAHLRQREADTGTHADIHEQNTEYLRASAQAARRASELCGWHRIRCGTVENPRTVEDIGGEIEHILEALWTN